MYVRWEKWKKKKNTDPIWIRYGFSMGEQKRSGEAIMLQRDMTEKTSTTLSSQVSSFLRSSSELLFSLCFVLCVAVLMQIFFVSCVCLCVYLMLRVLQCCMSMCVLHMIYVYRREKIKMYTYTMDLVSEEIISSTS